MALEIVRVCGSVDSGTLNTALRTYTNHFQGLWPSPVVDTDDEAVHVARWTDARAPPGPACLATSAKQENSSHLPCSPLRMVVCGSCTGRVWPRKDRCTCCRRRCTTCWMRECSSSQEGSGRLPRWTGSGLRAGTHTPQPAPPSLLQQAPIHLAPSPKPIFRLCGHCTTQNPATPSMLIEPDAPVRRSSADRGLSWWGFRGLAAWGFPQISDLVPGPGMTCTLHFSGQRKRQTGTSARDRPRGGVLTTFSRRHAMPRRRCHDWRESS